MKCQGDSSEGLEDHNADGLVDGNEDSFGLWTENHPWQ